MFVYDASDVADDQRVKAATETLEELEWCLEQLENIQTHRSVGHMASYKVGYVVVSDLDANFKTCYL